MSKRPSSTKLRREVFETHKWTDPVSGRIMMTCYICGFPLDPVRERWHAEHPTPHANGGTEVLPAHEDCHRPKTARDIKNIAKGRRTRDRHFGIKRSSGSFRKPPPGYKYDWSARRYVKEEP